MKEKFLLIQLPTSGRPASVFPLGIGYIAATLKNMNLQVELFDICLHGYENIAICEWLRNNTYDYFGINVFTTQYKYYKALVSTIRNIQPHAKIIAGGPLPTFQPKLLLERTETDFCVTSEGEQTIEDLIINIHKPEQIDGIAFRKDDQIIINKLRPQMSLHNLAHHPYDFFSDQYFKNVGLVVAPAGRTVNFDTSRGCPNKCHFCATTFRKVRYRPLVDIEEELKEIKKKYKIESVLLSDDYAVVNINRATGISDIMGRLKLKWICSTRVDTITPEILKHMAKNGCVGVEYGVESASQIILDKMNKRIKVEQAEQAIRWTKEAGITPGILMMYGYFGENDSTIQENIEFFRKLHTRPPFERSKSFFAITVPFPGSYLYQECREKGLIQDDEETFSLKLERGVFYDEKIGVLCNMTQYTDKELIQKKAWLEKEVDRNYIEYIRSKPFLRVKMFLKNCYWRWLEIYYFYRKNGNCETLKKIYNKLMKGFRSVFLTDSDRFK